MENVENRESSDNKLFQKQLKDLRSQFFVLKKNNPDILGPKTPI
jgi:hypothetical protein